MTRENIHFVTGRLSEQGLRAVLADLAPQVGFEFSVDVLPITVAALMTPQWIARHLHVPPDATRIMIPGYCGGDLEVLQTAAEGREVSRGPRDLRRLPEAFGRDAVQHDYGAYDIEILAEINHAPRLELAEILLQAKRLSVDGADLIDLGCDPSHHWNGVAECVRALRQEGHRVSIDSFSAAEVTAAVAAGAELVLSVNRTNREAARDWGCPVVAIPDDPATLDGLDETIEALAEDNVPFRIDPILEPIGCGFAQSLGRYVAVRRRYEDAEMMMGIGNLTELTDADSAAVNVILLGVCQELQIHSVLTTQVINWARTSVKECDLARRLVHFAVRNGIPPKHLEPSLVALRDPSIHAGTDFESLAGQIKDKDLRIYAEGGTLHVVGAATHFEGDDPFLVFDQLLQHSSSRIDASHAFYLGFELAKATIALTLGKQYEQDESLNWGFLTKPERWHRLKK
jgi:dihydropteroate synthase-like protein